MKVHMPRAAAALLVCAALAASSAAQDSAGEDDDPQEPAYESSAEPMSLADARINFPTVVRAFFDKRPGGKLRLRERRGGRMRRLGLVSVDGSKARATGEQGLYRAPVVLSDETTGEPVNTIFTVSFSGSEWSVKNVRVIEAKSRPKRKAAELQSR